ncbi:MAG: hypothetical protein P4M12_08560 [Gammaproteobacteria bacterium]|nr:hypothetical protein [Gammaproteobacteria bacterium]
MIKQGIVGLVLLITFQFILIFKIEPYANYYFPFIWFGYIFVVDAIVYQKNNDSLICNHFGTFCMMLIFSSIFWWVFEGINYFAVNDWHYVGSYTAIIWMKLIYKTAAFSTVLPAVWVTYDLVKALHLFDKLHFNVKYKINKITLCCIVAAGVISFILTAYIPTLAFPLVWIYFFLILDPINYMNKQPSIIENLINGKLNIPVSLMLAGLICGFFWEFWNYWAPVKWVYHLPHLNFIKIFEMPILGYFGYLFFAWELYAMYHFCMWLVKGKEVSSHLN